MRESALVSMGLIIVVAIGSQLLRAATAQSTTIRPFTVEEIVKGSAVVIEGDVTDGWLELSDKSTNSWAWMYRIDMVRAYKGSVTSGSVLLKVPAGCDDRGEEMGIPGAPRLSLGERLLVPGRVIDEETIGAFAWGSGFLRVAARPAGRDFVFDADGRLLTDFAGSEFPASAGPSQTGFEYPLPIGECDFSPVLHPSDAGPEVADLLADFWWSPTADEVRGEMEYLILVTSSDPTTVSAVELSGYGE